jgi:hypothetical protein
LERDMDSWKRQATTKRKRREETEVEMEGLERKCRELERRVEHAITAEVLGPRLDVVAKAVTELRERMPLDE